MSATVAVAILLLALGYVAAVHGSEHDVTFIVQHREAVAENSGGHTYLVYTDQGTFKVSDSLVYGRFNSSDLYGSLQEGHRYTCHVSGWRIPLFSSYPNLLRCIGAP